MHVLKIGKDRELVLLEGDIIRIAADAIVNAANSHLAGGGGVDGAIHAAGGPEIMRELGEIRNRIGSCPAGNAVATGAGRLPAKFVFHAVGPIFRGGHDNEAAQLQSCYRVCLDMAAERRLETITFPSISTGAYGYPLNEAAKIALETTFHWLSNHEDSLRRVTLVQFGPSDHRAYVNVARSLQTGWVEAASS